MFTVLGMVYSSTSAVYDNFLVNMVFEVKIKLRK